MSMGERWAQPNLLAGYHLEGLNDFSGNGYTLTNLNSVTFTPGKFANAANFGNPNTNKGLKNDSELGVSIPNSALSMACLLSVAATPASDVYWCIMDWESQTGTKGMISIWYHSAAGTPRLEVFTNDSASSIAYVITLTLNVWYHIVVTQTSGGALSLYLNGSLIGTGSHNVQDPTHSAISIGYERKSTSYYLSGLVDEVAIFNKQLSAIEIRKWYAWSKGLFNG